MNRRRKGKELRSPLNLPALAEARELFWQNVIREILTSLTVQRSQLAAQLEAKRKSLVARGQDPGEPQIEGFDGRMAVVTRQGERIPIADVTPIFACSIGGTQRDRALSEDVQCTIFQIRTPSGEVYTFPIGEIRGFHALTEEAMRQLERQAAEAAGPNAAEAAVPFGFAAYTSLSRELASASPADGAGSDDLASDAASPAD